MNKITIGKYTLESLTSGMYTDAFVVYREYIQNSVDSIDQAYFHKILTPGNEKVLLSIDPSHQQIEVFDNGMGIPFEIAEDTLTGIGNSRKEASQSRGFRGIGRLCALSYCKKLSFETTYPGEPVISCLVIDAELLSNLLTEQGTESLSAETVMHRVCSFEQKQGAEKDHYFKAVLSGITPDSMLLDYSKVIPYLQQVAPLPFSQNLFTWGTEICNRIRQQGYEIPAYNIFISNQGSTTQLFKPYSDQFVVDRKKEIVDAHLDIEVSAISGIDGKISAIVWIAHTNYLGTIADRNIKGLRLRKGNILIGDEQTLNDVFKDARFNGWSIGEVYVLDPALLPNARRDNFEKNTSYFSFTEKMIFIASNIAKRIRSASLKRNDSLQNAIQKSSAIRSTADDLLLKDGVSVAGKTVLTKKMGALKSEIAQATISDDDVAEELQAIAFEELDLLIGKINGATSYKAINLAHNLNKSEKIFLEKIFQALESGLTREVSEQAMNTILGTVSAHAKK